LLLSAVRAGDIGRERRAPSSNGAAARRSAANAGSVMLTAELTRLNIDKAVVVFKIAKSTTADDWITGTHKSNVCRNYCKMETQETRQDPVEVLIRYLTRGRDDLHVYADKCMY